jgi:hypothetical protein
MTIRRTQAFFAALVVAGALAAPAAAGADPYVGNDTPQVKGEDLVRGSGDVAGNTESRGLPITGGDVAGLTALGLASVGTGTVLVRRSRRGRNRARTA